MCDDDSGFRLSKVASAIAEPARGRMLCHLMDGTARTATELATVAGIASSTASAHLARLVSAGLLEVLAQSRHRYYRLTGEDVARSLETLLVVAEPAGRIRSSTPESLRLARTCYDHAAGELGVRWHDRLLERGWLEKDAAKREYDLSAAGKEALAGYGIDTAFPHRRKLAYPCIDWSERRPHLGGALGAALLKLGMDRQWIRRSLEDRALIVTPKGRRELREAFGIALSG
ncbi:ArsR/SmtB family transcription factor [Luteibacter yeojuensis]|uniref:Winged helix-turn-helix transcriptional regulator n=1 Tax=Luteibacter yeojuensis TaxID=345309 RepID=A0A7X5TQR4_9GAMM|nr:winged helix-turn-helix domain-containing protein [Luteibacter yeojuensis]NID16370.1 winged helix-turn-helix transcriptional regulator [Luteibacter yeojuensis]